MTELKADVLVLGAGMVGVGAALHLQQRGRDVILVDKHARAGEETSYGNGGLIESASVFPYTFPRDLKEILRYAMNRAPQVRYAVADLPAASWDLLPTICEATGITVPESIDGISILPTLEDKRQVVKHDYLYWEYYNYNYNWDKPGMLLPRNWLPGAETYPPPLAGCVWPNCPGTTWLTL